MNVNDELGEYQAEQYRRRHPIPSAQGRTRRRPASVLPPPQPVYQRPSRPLSTGWRLHATSLVHGVVNLYFARSAADVYEDPSQARPGRRADVIVSPHFADSLTVHTERVPCPYGRFRILVENGTNEPMAASGSVITVRVVGAE